MYTDHHYDYLDKFRYYTSAVAYSVHYISHLPVKVWDFSYLWIKDQNLLQKENSTLRKKNMQLMMENRHFSLLANENEHLKELQNSVHKKDEGKTIIAELISTDYTPFRQHIVINKGSRDNAYVNQPILGAKGVIGQIISITPVSATGMLISDPSHSMLAQIGESRIRALVVGTGNPKQLKLEYLPLDTEIKEGDIVSTSGLDGRYPPNYPIGRVSRITYPAGIAFADITVTPFVNLNRGREVLLIWGDK